MKLNRLRLAKGFTLIELAVVLVVIGIIIGMTFKGLELIDIANTRAEMQKLLKIRNSLVAWISVNTKTEAAGDFRQDDTISASIGKYVYRFTDLDDLTDDDRKNPFGPWYLTRGVASANGTNLDDSNGDTFFLYANNLSQRFVCYVETLLDDDNISTGTARALMSGVELDHPIGCYALNNDNVSSNFLYYRVF
jgi:prepilin-type N-terminal cleavage/methylation domain-containing protein